MSTIITGAIIENGPADRAQFMALLALAQYANPEGECFPKIETLEGYARMSERSLRRALESLEADGWIERTRERRRSGAFRNYTYRINREKLKVPVRRNLTNSAKTTGQNDRSPQAKMSCGLATGQNGRSNNKSHREQRPTGQTPQIAVEASTLTPFQQKQLREGNDVLINGQLIAGNTLLHTALKSQLRNA